MVTPSGSLRPWPPNGMPSSFCTTLRYGISRNESKFECKRLVFRELSGKLLSAEDRCVCRPAAGCKARQGGCVIKHLLRFILRLDMAILTRGFQLLVVVFYWLYLRWRDAG